MRADLPPADPGGALFAAMLAPLSMGALTAQLVARGGDLILFGSERVSRFAFFGRPERPGAGLRFFHWEHLLVSEREPMHMPAYDPW